MINEEIRDENIFELLTSPNTYELHETVEEVEKENLDIIGDNPILDLNQTSDEGEVSPIK